MIIPIFNYKLTVVIFDKWEELGRFLPKEEMEQEAKAITINQYGASLVAINSKRGSSIIHEAKHIKNSNDIEQKIVESTIVFWFKDIDCRAENKVVEYLGEY